MPKSKSWLAWEHTTVIKAFVLASQDNPTRHKHKYRPRTSSRKTAIFEAKVGQVCFLYWYFCHKSCFIYFIYIYMNFYIYVYEYIYIYTFTDRYSFLDSCNVILSRILSLPNCQFSLF